MNVSLPPEQQAFIDDLVQSGRFASPDDAISECVQLLISREQLRAKVGIAIEQADAGDVIDHDTVFASLRRRAIEIEQGAGGQ